ncbi:hypothetical protein C0Q70_04017 [Pomacea canaliculata]|uniref:GOLD domain-containing protein n=1 Tax=Pomacea canaliculata TaxID=400727 RepID=A0A2T7PUB7_POMCA|nr:hypothetical protein C0Q70_04017 [Pomacea canaliculata]
MAAPVSPTGCSLLCLLLLSSNFVLLGGEKVLGEENEDFDFDGLPGVQHEFKVEIPAGKEDCFFQRAAIGAKLHVSFEVLRGGDRNVDVIVRDSHWNIINAHYWKQSGVIEVDIPREDPNLRATIFAVLARDQGVLNLDPLAK